MRLHLKIAAIPVIAFLLACTAGAPVAAADPCPNEAVRSQQGTTFLPECRAYEMASPVDKNGVGLLANYKPGNPELNGGFSSGGFQIDPDGTGLLFTVPGALPGAESAPGFGRYRSRFVGGTWQTTPVDPPVSPESETLRSAFTLAVSEDLSRALVFTSTALAPGAEEGGRNVYIREVGTDNYTLVLSNPKLENWSGAGGNYYLEEVNPDLTVVEFLSSVKLTPDAPEGMNTYIWREGKGLSLLATDPSGNPIPEGRNANASNNKERTISVDGSRALFRSSEDTAGYYRGLYLKEGENPAVQVSASQASGDDPSTVQPAVFYGASEDLSVIYFTSPANLTDESNTEGEAASLFRYDVETGELTDLLTGMPSAERNLSFIMTGIVSDDGSTIYFYGKGGHLWVWQDGVLSDVADLKGTGLFKPHGAISPNNRYFAYESDAPLTSYVNEGPACNAYQRPNCSEIYVYDTVTENFSCASCNPTGAPPAGYALFRPGQVPGLPHESNVLTDDGMVVFETSDALVPRDVNGRRDVYVWRDGEAKLISTGRGDFDSIFADMSEDGSTIAFGTASQLVGIDDDQLIDAYVARVGGGLASQGPPAPVPPSCTESTCQGAGATVPGAQPIGSRALVLPGRSGRGAVKLRVSLRGPAGPSRLLRVAVSAPGSVRVSGRGLKTVSKGIPGAAGSVRLALTKSAKQQLERQGRLRLRVRVGFRPNEGRARSTSLSVLFVAKGA